MSRTTLVAFLLALCGFSLRAAATEPLKIIAAGDWSKPTQNSERLGSGAIRARLVVGERRLGEGRYETPIYVELQDASDAISRTMHLYCEMGRNDFRPEYKGGLRCELHDSEGALVASRPFPFGGQIPESQWIKVAADSTVRLRASPFGVARPGAMAFTPHLGQLWVIQDDDPAEYRLSGVFGVLSPGDSKPTDGAGGTANVWTGHITLPPVRIKATSQKRLAKSQKIPK